MYVYVSLCLYMNLLGCKLHDPGCQSDEQCRFQILDLGLTSATWVWGCFKVDSLIIMWTNNRWFPGWRSKCLTNNKRKCLLSLRATWSKIIGLCIINTVLQLWCGDFVKEHVRTNEERSCLEIWSQRAKVQGNASKLGLPARIRDTLQISLKRVYNSSHQSERALKYMVFPLQTTYSSPKSCKETKGGFEGLWFRATPQKCPQKDTYICTYFQLLLLPLASSYFQFLPLMNCWIFINCSGYISNSQKPGRASMSWVKPSKRCSDKTCR